MTLRGIPSLAAWTEFYDPSNGFPVQQRGQSFIYDPDPSEGFPVQQLGQSSMTLQRDSLFSSEWQEFYDQDPSKGFPVQQRGQSSLTFKGISCLAAWTDFYDP